MIISRRILTLCAGNQAVALSFQILRIYCLEVSLQGFGCFASTWSSKRNSILAMKKWLSFRGNVSPCSWRTAKWTSWSQTKEIWMNYLSCWLTPWTLPMASRTPQIKSNHKCISRSTKQKSRGKLKFSSAKIWRRSSFWIRKRFGWRLSSRNKN